MASQPITESDLSFFKRESARRREVINARRNCAGDRSKWLPGPEMQLRIINGVKLTVWMFIAITLMSYIIIHNTKGRQAARSNSFQDFTRQIIFKSMTAVEYV